MPLKLSIIIPCYNCASTLREALESCYVQGLAETEFEIIMVDDGSADRTNVLMQELAKEHNNIRLLYHDKNRGGGAARNTGIREAKGEIIYCLDSDNIFAQNSVRPMLDYLHTTGADGVAFYERRFFFGKNTKNYQSRFCEITNRNIELTDLFSKEGIMLDNFFYRKSAYLKTNGYPEHHGFDTQSYEIDFLARNLTVRIAPSSIFYHRQNQPGHKSYYEREYEKGLISINTFLTLEPIIGLLHSNVIESIASYDLFINNIHDYRKNLLSEICSIAQTNKTLLKGFETHSNKAELIIKMIYTYKNGLLSESWLYHQKCLATFGPTPFLLYFWLRLSFRSQNIEEYQVEKTVYQYLNEHRMLNKPSYKRLPSFFFPLLKMYLMLKR